MKNRPFDLTVNLVSSVSRRILLDPAQFLSRIVWITGNKPGRAGIDESGKRSYTRDMQQPTANKCSCPGR